MIDARFVYLEKWPYPRSNSGPRRESRFSATYGETLELLERELRHLGARAVVIQAGFRPDQIRLDGWPLGRANPVHADVILQFQTRTGQSLSFPCDRFRDYDSNLRAIALSLEALRAVDRYGVTRHAEQYAGWKQIAAPGAFATAEDAAEFILLHAYGQFTGADRLNLLRNEDARQRAYQRAAAKLHPDNPQNHGSTDMFLRLQDAASLLKRAL